jgi:S1-C subfamily serine protease
VKIKSIGAGKLKAIGLMEGDVILKVNNEPIETIDELSGKLSGVNRGVLLEIMTESGKREYKGLGL